MQNNVKTYPELVRGNRCRLVVVFAPEASGKWNKETAEFQQPFSHPSCGGLPELSTLLEQYPNTLPLASRLVLRFAFPIPPLNASGPALGQRKLLVQHRTRPPPTYVNKTMQEKT